MDIPEAGHGSDSRIYPAQYMTIQYNPIEMANNLRPNTIVPMRSAQGGGDPEEPFTDLTICMNLKDRLSCVCYDDNGKNHFTAEWKNGELAITTGLPVKQILLYGTGQLTEVTCNGMSCSWERRDAYTYSIGPVTCLPG